MKRLVTSREASTPFGLLVFRMSKRSSAEQIEWVVGMFGEMRALGVFGQMVSWRRNLRNDGPVQCNRMMGLPAPIRPMCYPDVPDGYNSRHIFGEA